MCETTAIDPRCVQCGEPALWSFDGRPWCYKCLSKDLINDEIIQLRADLAKALEERDRLSDQLEAASYPQEHITFYEVDGAERKLTYDNGDESVGIVPGYYADEKWDELKAERDAARGALRPVVVALEHVLPIIIALDEIPIHRRDVVSDYWNTQVEAREALTKARAALGEEAADKKD